MRFHSLTSTEQPLKETSAASHRAFKKASFPKNNVTPRTISYALIALSRLIRRIDDLVHRYESVVSEAKPLWQGQGIRDKESPIVGTSHSESYGGPPIKILDELVCELSRWRSSLPYSLRWSDEDRLAFTNIQPLRQPPHRRLFSRIGLDDPSEIDPSKDIVVAQLRTRYYRARFLVLRPFIYKALHNPWLMTAEDRVGCASAVEAMCMWPLALSPPKKKKCLIPHLLCYTQNFLAMLLISRMSRSDKYLSKVCEDGGIEKEHVESSIASICEWLEDVRRVDGIADWSLRVLGPLFPIGSHSRTRV